LQNRIAYLENLIYNINDISILDNRITELSNKVDNYKQAYSGSNVLLNMINDVNNKYNQLIGNTTPLEILYDANIIYSGNGIEIDRSVKNKLTIHNKIQGYNIALLKDKSDKLINSNNLYNMLDDEPEIYIYLKEYSNYVKIYNNGNPSEKLKLYIVDKINSFENGQVIRIVFSNNIQFSTNNIVIYSDYNNRLGYGKYGKMIANISFVELSNKPIIDLVCIDRDLLLFDYNIIN